MHVFASLKVNSHSIKLCNVPFNYEDIFLVRGLSLITYTCNTGGGWGGGLSLPLDSFAYYIQYGGGRRLI